jgi:hypothetical protein
MKKEKTPAQKELQEQRRAERAQAIMYARLVQAKTKEAKTEKEVSE